MADVVDSATRSRMMSGIRWQNTRPELLVRRRLHARGFRFRLHDRRLPGRPDLVFASRRSAIFVHGCFWHGHDCHLFKLPGTRREFWQGKIGRNRSRDSEVLAELAAEGWRVLVIWECALRGSKKIPEDRLIDAASSWLESDLGLEEIRGGAHGGSR